jgi:hypothetical protein
MSQKHPFEALPIPRIIWDSLEATLTAQVHKLVKDIAETLDKPAKPLLDAIKKEKVTAYLFEEPAHEMTELSTMRCEGYTRHPENPSIVCHCRQPIVWSGLEQASKRCPEHMHIKEILVSSSLVTLKPISIHEKIYYLRDNRDILTSAMELVGRYENSVATMFLKEVA